MLKLFILPINTSNHTFALGVLDTIDQTRECIARYIIANPKHHLLIEELNRELDEVNSDQVDKFYIEDVDDIVGIMVLTEKYDRFLPSQVGFAGVIIDKLSDLGLDINIHEVSELSFGGIINEYGGWISDDGSGINHLENIFKGLSNDSYISSRFIQPDPEFLSDKYFEIDILDPIENQAETDNISISI